MDRTIDAFGWLVVLVNNADVPHVDDRGSIENMALDAWEAVIAINVRRVFLMTRAAVSHMKARGDGPIVSMSSTAGLTTLPEWAAHCISKTAMPASNG